jgi:hypothetical protein
MAIIVSYEAGVGGAFEDISERFRRLTLDVTVKAEEGSVAISQVRFDDPDGSFHVVGWRRIHIYEDEEDPGLDLIYSGWVYEKNISRGSFHRTAGARVWDVSLADFNSMLEMRVCTGNDWDRPAETDIERLQFLMTTNEMSRILDDTYINTSGPKNMDAVNYEGQKVKDVIDDAAQTSGKNYFVISAHDAADRGLWYDFTGSTAYSSTIRVSNVIADVDYDTTFFMSLDAVLTRDPSRVYSGGFLRYDGGDVYTEDFTTSGIFTRRDAVYDAPNVKSSTKALARDLRYLADANTEEDRITCGLYLPRNRIGHIKAGQRMEIKATHLPGYESFGWARVLEKKMAEVSEGFDDAYFVTLVLSTEPIAASCSTAGGTLVIHTRDHPEIPHGDATYAIYAAGSWDVVDDEGPKVEGIAPGDYVYAVPPGQCMVVLKGESGGVGVPFDGVTWTPTGGGPTYYPENGDGLGGHFFEYDIATPGSFTGAASTWSFPVYAYAGAGGTVGVTDYGIGLNNLVAFELP